MRENSHIHVVILYSHPMDRTKALLNLIRSTHLPAQYTQHWSISAQYKHWSVSAQYTTLVYFSNSTLPTKTSTRNCFQKYIVIVLTLSDAKYAGRSAKVFVIIVSRNGLTHIWRQYISWINVDFRQTATQGQNFPSFFFFF